jgi:flagellin
MASILTNTSAMVALQTLKSTNKNMAGIQNQISTGMKVATAKDNCVGRGRSRRGCARTSPPSRSCPDSLTVGNAVVGVARAAAEPMVDILKQVQEKVVQSKEPGADQAKLGADIDALTETMASIAASAQYNGINLVNNTDEINIGLSLTRTGAGAISLEEFGVEGHDLATDAAITVTLTGDATDTSDMDEVEDALQTAIDAAAAFGCRADPHRRPERLPEASRSMR